MRTYVITGGTDGMGKGLGLQLLERGDRVIAVASGPAKGEAFLADAVNLGARDRAIFLRADLSTLTGMRAALTEITACTDTVDGVVFAAQRFRPRRETTPDGFEYTFALMYLSRYVLGHGLTPALERADAPVLLNIAAPGGIPGAIRWDDLQLRRRYSGMRAAAQASRCLDLLGVAYPLRYPDARTRYVLYNPLFTRTAMAEPLPALARTVTNALAALFAWSVERAVPPLVTLLDTPPSEPVAAFRRQTRLPLRGKDFDPARAVRLATVTEELLAAADR